MPILVRNIKLALDEPETGLIAAAARQLKVPPSAIHQYAPVRRSLDARDHANVHFVYHVEVTLGEDEKSERERVRRIRSQNVIVIRRQQAEEPAPGDERLGERPLIVGFGPAGMFAALRLIRFGFRPIILERGVEVRRRHVDVLKNFYRDRNFNRQSNLLFGEGGAGTYSDGKLYTRISDPLARTVLEWFYLHGADPDILVNARPHIGSNRLPTICRNVREYIIQAGGEIRFDSQLEDLTIEDGVVKSVVVNGERLAVGPVILAIGHSARDTIRMLYDRGIAVQARPFQIGVRIEHPQSLVDHWQYGAWAGHGRLPAAEYRVVTKTGPVDTAGLCGDCYSFCMCPGGMILPTNEDHGLIATNGASKAERESPFANSGLVITFPPQGSPDDPLAGIEFQRKWERKAFLATGETYRVPAQRASDFLAGRPSDGPCETSYPLGGQWTDIRSLVPAEVGVSVERALRILELKMPGFASAEAVIAAPETRVSAPVRFLRDSVRRTAKGIDNLYPAGDGAGYAGGIISAAVDGIKSADAVIRRYAPGS
ncbi:MAG: hypothetical protein V3W34_15050 [Phycisphaerae bacterium]